MPVAGGGFGNLSSGRQQKAPQPESAISFSAKKRGTNRVATTATRALRAGLTAGLNTRGLDDGEDERPPSPVKTQEPVSGKARNVSGHKIVEYDTKVASAPLPSGGFSWAQRAGGGRPAAAPARPQWHEEDEDESPAAEAEVEEKVEAIPNGVAPPAAPAAPVVPASAPASTPAPAPAAGGFSWAQRLGGGKAGQEGRRPSPSRQEVAKPPAQEVTPQRLPSPVVEEEPKQDFVPPTQVQAPAPPRPQRERSPPRGVTGRTAPAAPAAPAAVEKVEVKASAFDRMKAVSVPFDLADLRTGSAGFAPVNGVSQSKKPTITTEQSSALFHSQSEALVISDSILRAAPRSTGRRFTFSAPKAPSPALSPAVVPSPVVDAASKTPPQELVVPSAQPEAMPIAAVQAEVPHVPKVVDQSTQGTSPLVFPAAQQQVYPSSAAVAPRVPQTSTVEAGTSPLFAPTLPNTATTTNVVHATEYGMPAPPAPPRGTVTQSKVYNRSQWGGASSAAPTVPVLPQTYGYQTQAQPQQPQPPQPQQPSRMVQHPAATGPPPSYSSGGMGGRMPAMPSQAQAALQTKRPGFGTMGMGDPSAYSKGPTSGMTTGPPPGLQTGGRPGVSSGQRPMPPASFGTSPYSYNAYMYPQWMQPDAYNYQQYAAYSGTPSYPQGLPAATQYGYGQGGGYSAYPTAGYGAPSTQMSAPSWSSTGGRGGAPRQ